MIRINSTIGALTLLVGGALAGSSTAGAADPAAGDTKAQIAQALHAVEKAFARDAGGEELARMLYTDNVTMIGEGEDKASRGMDTAIADSKGWLESLGPHGGKTCKYTIEEPVVASSTTFSSFLLLRCKANPPVLPQDQDLRMMYVWEKTSKGWRVVLEMWAPGKF
jgi:ketosteroid isomerase-like protein